jgi:hypothetical protein
MAATVKAMISTTLVPRIFNTFATRMLLFPRCLDQLEASSMPGVFLAKISRLEAPAASRFGTFGQLLVEFTVSRGFPPPVMNPLTGNGDP